MSLCAKKRSFDTSSSNGGFGPGLPLRQNSSNVSNAPEAAPAARLGPLVTLFCPSQRERVLFRVPSSASQRTLQGNSGRAVPEG